MPLLPARVERLPGSGPAWSSVLSEGTGDPQVVEKAGAGQGLSMGCLISKPAGVPGYQSKSCLKP